MSAIFRLLAIDYVQWKAVSRTLLRSDFRLPLNDRGSAFGRIGGLISLALMLSLYGIAAAVVVFIGRDVLVTTTLALVYLSVMLAAALMTQHGITMLATADFAILAPRPVSSRTFLAIRLTNVLFHTLVITTLMAYPVVLAYLFAGGLNIPRAIGGTVAIYAWAVVVMLAVVASYSALLQAVGAARFSRAMGYLQLAAGILAYGGLFLATRVLGDVDLAHVAAPDRWWLALIPPAWFATYVEIASGATNSTTFLRLTLSVALLVALGFVFGGRIGLDYASRLADLTATADAPARRSARTPGFAGAEARAAAILVLAHFRHDLRVRMGILAIVPLIVFYLLLGTQERTFDLAALAVLLFPALLTRQFASSDAYQARWIYDVTPCDRTRLVIAVKNIAAVYFVLPFLLFMAAVFAWRLDSVPRALLHTAMLGIISHIALQGSIIVSPRLPFALPPDKTSGNAFLMTWLILVILGGQAALWLLDRYVYVAAARTAGALALLVMVTLGLNHVIAWRVRRYSQPTR